MSWSKTILSYIEQVKEVKVDTALLYQLMSVIDLTSLNLNDTDDTIIHLSQKAENALGHVAAICIYPRFVRMLADEFANSPIKVGTVANFPEGKPALENTLIEIGAALADGAQELDIVFPYTAYLEGNVDFAQTFVNSCKAACGDGVTLKIILETGALKDLDKIAHASELALTAGADFIKTSTGKMAQGGSLEAAAVMLLTMQKMNFSHKGFKISGGIRDIKQAASHLFLAANIMGKEWVTREHFRIGSSHLVDVLLQEISQHA
jgi:deoxyribose-phosphate aldolase